MQNCVNREHGPYRRPVGGARTAVSSETPGRWARPTVARYASGAQRCSLVLRTGAPWHDLPRRYPPYQTCHRRFQQWQRFRVCCGLLENLAEDLRDRGKLDLSETFIDATFSSAKKGALLLGRSFSYDINTAKSVRLQPLKYRFCSSHTDSLAPEAALFYCG